MENEFKDTEIGKIPVDWEVVTVEQIQNPDKKSIISGPFGSNISSKYFVESGIPVIRGNNLKIGPEIKFIDEGFVFVTEEKASELGTWAKINDLVFTAAGTLGQVGIITPDLNYKKYIISNKQLRLRVNEEIISPIYAYYWFSSNLMLKYITLRNTGSTIPLINLSVLKKLPIPLPPLEEQQKIAQILSALDEKIENNNLQNKILEETANSIFKEWFVNFNFLDDEGKPYFENGGEVEHNDEIGKEIPKGWSFDELTEFGKIVCGKTPSKSVDEYFCGETPFIKIPDMHNKMFLVKTEDSLTEKGVQSQKNKVIPANSVCVSCIATVGLVSITVKESQTNQQINSIIPKNDNLTMYLYFTLKSMTEYIKILASGGSATLNLNTTEFSKIKIIMPEKDILEKYHKKMEPLKNKILSNEIENQNLSNLRDILLPKLINGQIRLK
ncbi:restriction endonuclease subunit S [Methanococcus maripaludis]|uniref:Type I restriction enzyme S subunit n=1 Tax=Methanococcus maripaludis TaxID=39152 RepID=A0A8T4CKB1_METMI|nr:restriction endonuclease subunit S [Methanococcus maripaludis]MBM7408418.1 type I restriction enzyme S subunit [Methanococcus maripaludis]MBP2220088.1 type I restriction enzyme S subunit [Methanococcus maripaludis]